MLAVEDAIAGGRHSGHHWVVVVVRCYVHRALATVAAVLPFFHCLLRLLPVGSPAVIPRRGRSAATCRSACACGSCHHLLPTSSCRDLVAAVAVLLRDARFARRAIPAVPLPACLSFSILRCYLRCGGSSRSAFGVGRLGAFCRWTFWVDGVV